MMRLRDALRKRPGLHCSNDTINRRMKVSAHSFGPERAAKRVLFSAAEGCGYTVAGVAESAAFEPEAAGDGSVFLGACSDFFEGARMA